VLFVENHLFKATFSKTNHLLNKVKKMKKILPAIVMLSIFLCSCNSDDDSITDEVIQHTYSTNSKIVTQDVNDITFADIEEGDNLVFKYRFTASQDNDIADDEYGERIIFEIDVNATEFSYSDDELESILTFFNQYCFCPNIGSIQILNGNISGTKIDSQNWNIDIDVTFEMGNSMESKTISAVFKPE